MNSGLSRHLILGAGPAGLATGFFATRSGLPVRLFEAADRVGGNAITHQHGAFRFDSGAHRFHDKDPEMTAIVRELLGADLLSCELPSQIVYGNRWVDFPLTPLNLLRSFGPASIFRATTDLIRARLNGRADPETFESRVVHTYGRFLAEIFLLPYSKKLWGVDGCELSPSVSGKRLKGLQLGSFVRELLLGRRAKVKHLDGRFYYPKHGFGMVAEALADAIGREHIELESRVTSIRRSDARVESIEINGERAIPASQVINTLPLTRFLKLLDPLPPADVLEIAARLRFRNVLLVAIGINRPRVTGNGSIYFSDARTPITRVYEPKNRSPFMSPPDQTQLVAEIPCWTTDSVWNAPDAELIERVAGEFTRTGLIRHEDVVDGCVRRMHSAYPVLKTDTTNTVARIRTWLSRLTNVDMAGRGGDFAYTHVHDILRSGQTMARAAAARAQEESSVACFA